MESLAVGEIKNNYPAIVGTWRAKVTIEEPGEYPDFEDLITIHADGTVCESRCLYKKNPSLGTIIQSPGHGSWKEKDGRYVLQFLFFQQSAFEETDNALGFIGIDHISYLIEVGDQNTLTGKFLCEVKSPEGSLMFSAIGKMEATRIVPSEPEFVHGVHGYK